MDRADIALVRSTFAQGLATTPPESLLATLEGLGFTELSAAEPAVAVGELFEALGRLLGSGPALDLVVAAALGTPLAAGTALLHPDPRATTAVGSHADAPGTLRVSGLVLGGHRVGAPLLVPAMVGSEARAFAVPANAPSLNWRAVRGADPDAGWHVVEGETPAQDCGVVDAVAGTAAARRAVGHELVGVGSALLAIGVEHVTQREQFGKPIATFQSVRHRLADVHAALTAARNLLAGSWAEGDPMLSDMLCDVAKAQAGRAALLAAQHTQQVCGAMGYTWEHGLHRFVRRAMTLDSFYGRSSALTVAVGRRMLESGRVPRFLPIHLATTPS